MSTTIARQIAKEILSKNNLNNKIQVKTTNFSCSRFNNSYINIIIKDWEANPISDSIEKEIKTEGCKHNLGFLITFSGKGFVQD